MQSGQPVTVMNGAAYPRGDYNADGTTGDRPNNPAESVKRSGFSTADYLSGIFKVSDFPIPAPGTDGNLDATCFADRDLSGRMPPSAGNLPLPKGFRAT